MFVPLGDNKRVAVADALELKGKQIVQDPVIEDKKDIPRSSGECD
jgi:hypothetical protein